MITDEDTYSWWMHTTGGDAYNQWWKCIQIDVGGLIVTAACVEFNYYNTP